MMVFHKPYKKFFLGYVQKHSGFNDSKHVYQLVLSTNIFKIPAAIVFLVHFNRKKSLRSEYFFEMIEVASHVVMLTKDKSLSFIKYVIPYHLTAQFAFRIRSSFSFAPK